MASAFRHHLSRKSMSLLDLECLAERKNLGLQRERIRRLKSRLAGTPLRSALSNTPAGTDAIRIFSVRGKSATVPGAMGRSFGPSLSLFS